MKKELLLKIKEELEIEKEKNEKRNRIIKRIRELQKSSEIKEYLELRGLDVDNSKLTVVSEEKIISEIYYKYVCEIKETETNGIYVYLGTYMYNYTVDIEHGSIDYRVDENNENANYRKYCDIEQCYPISIPISKCQEFESTHTVINPKGKTHYLIQSEFFINAVKTNQESAKKKILRKYPSLNINYK